MLWSGEVNEADSVDEVDALDREAKVKAWCLPIHTKASLSGCVGRGGEHFWAASTSGPPQPRLVQRLVRHNRHAHLVAHPQQQQPARSA
jgi:hypothetical protein